MSRRDASGRPLPRTKAEMQQDLKRFTSLSELQIDKAVKAHYRARRLQKKKSGAGVTL